MTLVKNSPRDIIHEEYSAILSSKQKPSLERQRKASAHDIRAVMTSEGGENKEKKDEETSTN